MKKILLIIIIVLLGFILFNQFSQPSDIGNIDLDFSEFSSYEQEEGGADPVLIESQEQETQTSPSNETEDDTVAQQEECSSDDCPAGEGKMIVKIPIVSNTGEIILVDRYVPESPAVLNAVYRALFDAPRTVLYGEFEAHSQGSNPSSGSGLDFQSVAINNSVATVNLVGNFMTQEMADFAFRKQINEAAFQYPSVDIVEVFLNGERFDWCIADQSDGEGGCPDDPRYWIDAE